MATSDGQAQANTVSSRQNPYEGISLPALTEAEQHFDLEAKGLTGEMLDGMLSAAFTEGARVERRRAGNEAARSLPKAWSEGYQAGAMDVGAAVDERARPASDRIVGHLNAVRTLVGDSHINKQAKSSVNAILSEVYRELDNLHA